MRREEKDTKKTNEKINKWKLVTYQQHDFFEELLDVIVIFIFIVMVNEQVVFTFYHHIGK